MEEAPPRNRNRAAAVRRRLAWGAAGLLAVGVVGAALALAVAPDAAYRWHGWLAGGRYQEHDALIRQVAAERGLDPQLLKAMAWRESEFDMHKGGPEGRRGLLQIREPMAREWAGAEGIETFMATDLFDAQTNLRVGAWALEQARKRWPGRDRPEWFALAEFRAGRMAVDEWGKDGVDAETMLSRADAGTQAYVRAVMARRNFYAQYGW